MSHARTKIAFPAAFKPKKLSEIKDKDEQRFLVDDAVRTFRRFGEMEREISDIKADQELFKAAQARIAQEDADTKKALAS